MQKTIAGLIVAAVGLLLFSDLFPWGVVRWGVVKWLLVLLALVLYVLVMGSWGLAEERRLERKEQEEWSKEQEEEEREWRREREKEDADG